MYVHHYLLVVVVSLGVEVGLVQGQDLQFGAGASVGSLDGVAVKYWMNNQYALAAAFTFNIADEASSVTLQADWLVHQVQPVDLEEGQLATYLGVGGAATIRDVGDELVSLRVPVGMTFMLPPARVDVFVEVAPSARLIPSVAVGLDAALGARYYFGGR